MITLGTSRQKGESGLAVSVASAWAFLLSKTAGRANAKQLSKAQAIRCARLVNLIPPRYSSGNAMSRNGINSVGRGTLRTFNDSIFRVSSGEAPTGPGL